ncbi:TFIIE1 [Lepeophtheirus salmonis]|uniref:TFIIE1 n=1 Tax=Lepeophtheirus salmonis TaxID=72036 RepID=A0A7R8CCL1_LEPSM|nr:TFIIE1 [Lepeophtheirus salmonis]CAF2766555.1 TFIIE1 [Lepeophtheirus salmonis]
MLVTEVPSGIKGIGSYRCKNFLQYRGFPYSGYVGECCALEWRVSKMTSSSWKVKHKMETGEDEKAIKMNCYYINFKTFVNIVKYKLDHMHKKMETSERDATARSSFKFDEDASAGPQHNSRALLARFNTQMERLYDLLRAVEEIKLAPIVLEPEPVELYNNNRYRGDSGRDGPSVPGGNWSGEASRGTGGFRVDNQQVNITFGEHEKQETKKKEVPVWITESTITSDDKVVMDEDSTDSAIPLPSAELPMENDEPFQTNDEITSLLLRHEKRNNASSNKTQGLGDSDSSDESDPDPDPIAAITSSQPSSNIMNIPIDEEIMSDDDDDDGEAPTIRVGNEEILLSEVNEEIIARMTSEEKERYRQFRAQYTVLRKPEPSFNQVFNY